VVLMLIDRFNRPLTSLRISVTEKCNHKCVFCHREGLLNYNSAVELTPGDWGFVARVCQEPGHSRRQADRAGSPW